MAEDVQVSESLARMAAIADLGSGAACHSLAIWYYNSPRAWAEKEKAADYLRMAMNLGYPGTVKLIRMIVTEDKELGWPVHRSLEKLLAEADCQVDS